MMQKPIMRAALVQTRRKLCRIQILYAGMECA
jgi:hypothetical protein